MLLSEHCSMGVLYDTYYVSIVIQLTWTKRNLQVKNIPHMYVICVVKNGSIWVCRCRAIPLWCLICSWLVIGCCWSSACLLCCKLLSQHSTTMLTAASIKDPKLQPVALRSHQPVSRIFHSWMALLFLLLLRVLPLGTLLLD